MEINHFIFQTLAFKFIIKGQLSEMDQKIASFEEIQTQDAHSIAQNTQSRHFGNTIVVKWRQDGQPKYVLGPHFIIFICTLIISTLIFGAMAISLISDAKGNHQIFIALTLIFALSFYIYSYISVGISNPGLASSSQELSSALKSNLRYCVPCKIVRPHRTVHCYSCDICIHGYDHHCPWVGKCIGRDNMGKFKCFIFSIMLALSLYGFCVYLSGKGDVIANNV